MTVSRTALVGAGLVALYTGAIAAADGITKLVAGSYAAPQLFALSSGLVILLSLGAARKSGEGLRVRSRGAMALRSVLTVLAAIGFFQAFRLLPFADVFLFIALVPAVWAALTVGVVGLLCLMPAGRMTFDIGHLWALFAALTGTGSMVAARYIARVERVPLAQVFWPNLAVMICMGVALPFVWQPMPLADLGWVAAYALFLFAARWLSVEALRLLPAYVATPLMNLQFVWMVAIGWFGFGELPGAATLLGVTLVVGSSMWLVADEALLPARRTAQA
ncbi:DMT family transporter [Salipiger sp. HF18]|uniref:DMT family transporter n=1 Tax=Salipiger sp. HF18 TaxID=2721557 RepID=UPI00142E5C09|nr:DMT family transporter [Salipiger sp. HF18]NIY99202.1 DMT family transporter [Salipiger sp. HF18]